MKYEVLNCFLSTNTYSNKISATILYDRATNYKIKVPLLAVSKVSKYS